MREGLLRNQIPCSLVLWALACGDPNGPGAVRSVDISPDSVFMLVGGTTQLTATLKDKHDEVLSGLTVSWNTETPAVATVSAAGVVTAVGPGRAVITATIGKRNGSGVVNAARADFVIEGAQFTQGVQAADGSLQTVIGGLPAVVNVLMRVQVAGNVPMQVVLRLYDAIGTLVRADTAITGAVGPSPTYAAPSAQFLVPSASLQPGMQWEVVRDPRGVVPDDSAANDVFPRLGPSLLPTIQVPPLKLRFVPITLTAHGNATGNVTSGSLTEYLRTLKSVQPIGAISPVVGSSLSTTASFGAPPSGGDQGFWVQVLGELDLARVADNSDPDRHWYGVVVPPSGFNFTIYGGFAYIPVSGASTGPSTRTAVAVQVGWFNNQARARELVAHELGHNFGRRHAPCGNPADVDPSYPVAGGTIGTVGHDVYSWSAGLASAAATIAASTGDIMSYCSPSWASPYTWRGVRDFRQPVIIVAPPQPTRVLIVRGTIHDAGGVSLSPGFALDARPAAPERTGGYRLEGRAADGRELFARDFGPSVLDHAPTLHPFTFAIPLTPDVESALSTIVVRGPAGVAAIARQNFAIDAAPPVTDGMPNGLARVSCGNTSARGILVHNAATGEVLGTAGGSFMAIRVSPGTPLDVACSDGVTSVSAVAVAP